MVACVPATQEKIRAEVWMGSTKIAETPFIQSFSVNESRSQITNTFTVTLEAMGDIKFPLREKLIIKAGTVGNLRTIMTGTIESTTVKPSFGKPTYFLFILGGKGVLSALKNKKFSRRLKSSGQGVFCLITGGKKLVEAGFTLTKNVKSGNHKFTGKSPDPARNKGEESPLNVHNSVFANQARGGAAAQFASPDGGGSDGGRGGGGFRPHTHENVEEGGPAFAVYSSD